MVKSEFCAVNLPGFGNLHQRRDGEDIVHGDVAPCVSECTAQLPDNVFSQILLNFFPWLPPHVSHCIGDTCDTRTDTSQFLYHILHVADVAVYNNLYM